MPTIPQSLLALQETDDDLHTTRRRIRAWLIQKEGPRPDRVYQLKDTVSWIGRDPRSDIFLEDDTVSGQHAKLWVDDDRVLRLLNGNPDRALAAFVGGARNAAAATKSRQDVMRILRRLKNRWTVANSPKKRS